MCGEDDTGISDEGTRKEEVQCQEGYRMRTSGAQPSPNSYCPGRHQTAKSLEVWRDELRPVGNIPYNFEAGAQSTKNIAAGKLSRRWVQDRLMVYWTYGGGGGRLESRKLGCCCVHPNA